MEQTSTDGTNYAPASEGPDGVDFNSDLAGNIWIYGSPVIIVIGTVGNLLSAVVMLRPNLRKCATSLYLLVLAVVDTLVLYTGLLRHWIRELLRITMRNGSNAACRIHLFVLFLAIHVEAWIIVCVAIERMVAVFFPHKAKHIFTRRFAARQIAIIGAILAVFNSHFYWTQTLVNGHCLHDSRHAGFIENIFPWINFCLTSLIPFLVMIVANSAITAKVLYANYVRKVKLNVGKDQKLTSMMVILLSISVIFLLTTAPMSVLEIVLLPVDDLAPYRVVWSSLNLLFYTNYSVIFLLYCVSGTRFRREFFGICRREEIKTSHVRLQHLSEKDSCYKPVVLMSTRL